MRSSLLTTFRAAFAAALLVALILPLGLAAQDFSFYEASPRAAALGGAFISRSDDTTGLFYNPAGLAFLGGFRIKADIFFGNREITAAWPDGGDRYRTEPSEFNGNVSLSWQPVKRVTLATGIFFPYGFETSWTPGWPGESVITRNRLRTFYFRSALAVEVFKGFALSAGVDVVTSSLWYRHLIPFNIPNYPLPRDVNIEGSHSMDASGLGFAAGVLWKIVPAVQIGARYQSEVSLEFSGSNTFTQPVNTANINVPKPGGGTIGLNKLIDLYFADQETTGALTMPRVVAGGVTVTPIAPLSLSVDYEWDRWSGFGDWIFTSTNEGGDLAPGFTPEYEEFYGMVPDYGVQGVPLTLMDTKSIKSGVEYRPARYLAVRAGYAHLQGSVDADGRTPVYPDLDRNVYSLGFGYEGPLFAIWDNTERVSDLSFDIYIRYATAKPGASTFPGLELTYESSRLTFGVGAGFAF